MNLTSYQTLIEKIGLSKLSDANKETYNIVKEGSSNFTDQALWNEMLADADIREAYELHVKALENMAKEEPKAEMKVVKRKEGGKKTLKAKYIKTDSWGREIYKGENGDFYVDVDGELHTMTDEGEPNYPAKNVIKSKLMKNRKKPKPIKKVKSVKLVKTVTVKKVKKKEQVKFPVTVKRFSKEIQLIRRMINMDGKRKGINSLNIFDRYLQKTLKIHPDRKPVIKEMADRIKTALKKASDAGVKEIDITIDKAFKDKLMKANNPKPKMKVEYLSGPAKKSGKKKSKEVRVKYESHIPMENTKPKTGMNGAPAISDKLFRHIDQIDRDVKDTFRLNGDLGIFLGDLEEYKLAVSIEGDQGAGKTQLAFQLADGFADLGYNVGLFELEIGADSNIIVRMRNQYIKPENIKKVAIAGDAPKGIHTVREYAKKFGVIIIDSWTKLEVDSKEFNKLRKDFPGTIWIVLFQRNAINKIRGGTRPLYDAGINIKVVRADDTFYNNYAVAQKNRYGMTGLKYNISRMMIDRQLEEPEMKEEETEQSDYSYLQD